MVQLITTLSEVTVYPDRARIVRQGTAALPAGTQTIEIGDLPVQLNADSVRASARGTAQARLLGVQVQRRFYAETPAGDIRQLEEQIEALQDEGNQLEAQAELVKQYRLTMDSLAEHTDTYATALASGEITVDGQLALLDGLRARSEKLDAELRAIAQSKRDLDRRVAKLKNELDQRRSVRPRERYAALVEVEVLQAGDLTVALNYVINGAGWKPLYDLRLLEDGEKSILEVGYLAQVGQQTGEAWENVMLTLSTARPALAGRLPELDAWYIQPRPLPPPMPAQAAPPRGGLMAKMAVAAPMEANRLPSSEPLPETFAAEEVTARVDTAGAAVSYQVPGAVTIPPDGAPQKVVVARFPLPPILDYVAAPKLVEAAYRRANVVNTSPYLLLAGAANLFAGDEFIGTTQLELTAPEGEIELYLGVDDRIKVERELKRREVDKTIIGGKRRMRYGYEIKMENLCPTEVKITLHDQIPVARHEEIKVKLEAADPKPTEQAELNLLNWDITLAAKEKRVVRFDFIVEFPQTMDVIGMP